MTVLTTPDHQREYVTVAEVAAELACSEPTVRRRIRAGELPAVQLGGRARPCGFPAPGSRRGCGPNPMRRAEHAASDEKEKRDRPGQPLALLDERQRGGRRADRQFP